MVWRTIMPNGDVTMPAKQHIKQLSKTKARQHARRLRQEIERHDYLYYVEGRPEISDSRYERLKHELFTIERTFPDLIIPGNPAQWVGGKPKTASGSVRHKSPMFSLEAISTEAEFRRFYEHCCERLGKRKLWLVAEPNYDGLSAELAYWRGELASAATRGDGETGEDVTANVRTIRELPAQLRRRKNVSIPQRLVVRGEVYMDKQAFAMVNRRRKERNEKTFANSRLAAAGSLRQLDPKVTARRPLRILFWELVEYSHANIATHWRRLQELKKLGLPVDRRVALLRSPNQAVAYYKKLRNQRNRLPYVIDGTVFKANEVGDQKRLGTCPTSPRWAVAWKFAAHPKVARIKKAGPKAVAGTR